MEDLNRIAESLQDAEIKVLRSFGAKDKLGELQGMNQNEFLRAGMWLDNKGLIETIRVKEKIIILDVLGKKYLTSKLPELKLVALLKKKDLHLVDLEKHMNKDEIRFAVGYLKQRGLVEYRAGLLSITPTGKKLKLTPEFQLLIKTAKAGELSLEKLSEDEADAYRNLNRRKQIIKTIERTHITFKITALGKKVIPHIPQGERIGILTKDMIKSGSWKKQTMRRYDVSAPVPPIFAGKKQAYRAFLDEVKQKLVAMGFQKMDGPIVENEFFNNDVLFMPQDHPARGIHDLYYIKGKADLKKYKAQLKSVAAAHENGDATGSIGWRYKFSTDQAEKIMLRSQGTAVSARMLASPDVKIPGKYFTIARVYRPDVVDWKHLTEFNHLEGIVLGTDVNFRQLLSLLRDFAKDIAGVDDVKFLPGYFPFTEPSVEGYIQVKGVGWIEVMPAGIIRPEVTEPLGIKVPVLAWGIGIDRLFMIREGIKDIRKLFSNDLKYLRRSKV